MDFEALAEQHLALAGIHRNIAAIYLDAAQSHPPASPDVAAKEDRPGCIHPASARIPTTYMGAPAFICKMCNAIIGSVVQEEQDGELCPH